MIPFPGIDPVAVHIGPLAIRWYALAYITGILSAWWLMKGRAARPGSTFYAALGLVIGDRLGYTMFYNFHVYVQGPFSTARFPRSAEINDVHTFIDAFNIPDVRIIHRRMIAGSALHWENPTSTPRSPGCRRNWRHSEA